jgi:hypothetical protein
MEQSKETIKWRGREIEVRFNPDWPDVYQAVYGYALCHLEIRSLDGTPLPISDTLYRSRFDRTNNVEAAGGPAAFVLDWLEIVANRYAKLQQPIPGSCPRRDQLKTNRKQFAFNGYAN